jgi:photosystem II stability/assembly factor-like uncharacterized protein
MRKLILPLVLLLCAPLAVAQTKKTSTAAAAMPADQHVKAVWEPVNYPEDLELNDVFFVTDQEGWITGGKNLLRGGVILHTSDGGDHWDAQVGDPQSSDPPFHDLRFIDPTHGWATQRAGSEDRLLHTTDGAHWLAAGRIKEHYSDYQFTSDNDGVVARRDDIFTTHDGGLTWSLVFKCHAKLEVKGLTRETRCEIVRMQFLTPQTGFAIGHSEGSPVDQVFVARTADGGQSWNLNTSPVTGQAADAFFIDERTGYLRTGSAASGQIFKTSDGGATWQGLAGSPGKRISFADPEVGWAVNARKVSFTHDGGGQWNSREYPFPTSVTAFSLPRRDRGYVVGLHGMIYRYRVVPVSFAAQGMIEAPRLTPIDFTVPNQLQQLSAQVQSLQAAATTTAGAMPPSAATATTTMASTTSTTGVVPPGTDTATTTTASGAAPAVTQQLATVENTLNAVAAQTPAFVSRYRNLNLLMVGLQMASQLPQQVVELKQSLAALKSGTNAQARAAAVVDFSTKLQNVVTFMNTNFHSQSLAKTK